MVWDVEPNPPICTHCKKPCTLFITLVAGGKATTYTCCEHCPSSMTGPLTGSLPSEILGIKLHIPMPKIQGSCPSCGFRWEDFERTHRIGCPQCYEAHTQEILPTLSRIQPAVEHTGRRPQPTEVELKNRLKKAKDELAVAVKNEDFETAAALRDQIAELGTKFSVK